MMQTTLTVAIKDARKEAGLTQLALAERLGTTQGAVSNWENGDRVPDRGYIASIHEVLGIPLSILLDPQTLPDAEAS